MDKKAVLVIKGKADKPGLRKAVIQAATMGKYCNSFDITGFIVVASSSNATKQAVVEGKVGRPSKAKEVEKVIVMFKEGKVSMEHLQALTGLSKSTLYRYIKE